MKIYKPNERIPFTDEIMFSLVMRDENICRKLLNLILPGEEFEEIRFESSEDAVSYTHLTLPTICSV